jgi:ribosomal protein S18 acetylase RimI-like enzyme
VHVNAPVRVVLERVRRTAGGGLRTWSPDPMSASVQSDMTCEDWRNLPAEDVEPLLLAERQRWLTALGWETRTTWVTVEAARASGRLPGLIVRDGGRITGWAFYLLHGDMVQIGALVADEARGLGRLVDEILQVPEAAHAERASLFVLPTSDSLATALTRRRFRMRAHEYLTLDLATGIGRNGLEATSPQTGSLALRPFRDADEPSLVRLLAEAYRGMPSAECFAPHGRPEEWAWYVRQLLRTSACGMLLPEATLVVEAAGRDGPAGIVLTTKVSESTAHVAQIVVSPHAQRAGVGTRLLDAAIARARTRGSRQLTLMVSDDNPQARALYMKAGFVSGPTFLYAGRLLPRRLARAS